MKMASVGMIYRGVGTIYPDGWTIYRPVGMVYPRAWTIYRAVGMVYPRDWTICRAAGMIYPDGGMVPRCAGMGDACAGTVPTGARTVPTPGGSRAAGGKVPGMKGIGKLESASGSASESRCAFPEFNQQRESEILKLTPAGSPCLFLREPGRRQK